MSALTSPPAARSTARRRAAATRSISPTASCRCCRRRSPTICARWCRAPTGRASPRICGSTPPAASGGTASSGGHAFGGAADLRCGPGGPGRTPPAPRPALPARAGPAGRALRRLCRSRPDAARARRADPRPRRAPHRARRRQAPDRGHPAARLDSHRLIEEFMILANIAAAEELEARHQACMYRVHDQPDPEKLAALRDFLGELGIPGLALAKGQVVRPELFNRVLERAAAMPEAAMINELVLRAQAQAVYSPDNLGHFGLALARYAHFTSPIRRYADLLVHRALIAGTTPARDAGEALGAIGEHISATERRAAAAERAAGDRGEGAASREAARERGSPRQHSRRALRSRHRSGAKLGGAVTSPEPSARCCPSATRRRCNGSMPPFLRRIRSSPRARA